MTEETSGTRPAAPPSGRRNPVAKEDAPSGVDPATEVLPDQGVGPAEDAGALRTQRHVLDGLRREAAAGAAAGARLGGELGHAAEAIALEIVPTPLHGSRALVGHVLGMHLTIHAGGLHGPREAPSLLYLFHDAVAIRPADDAPMSTVPVFGLHMLLPPLAIARWVYKASRVEHANLDLVEDVQRFSDSLAKWTVDEFSEADAKLEVHRVADIAGPLHVYEHLGFANISIPVVQGRPVHLKSALPVTSDAFVKLWQLFALVSWPNGFSTEVPLAVSESGGG